MFKERFHTKAKLIPAVTQEELLTEWKAFIEQMGDIIEYRTTDYYQRRYRKTGWSGNYRVLEQL